MFIINILLQFINRRVSLSSKKYDNWEDATKDCESYDNEKILKKTFLAALKVKKNKNKFQQDSVILKRRPVSSIKIMSLLISKIYKKKKIIILDYGGGFCNYYYQNRELLNLIKTFRLYIIDQKKLVDLGTKFFSNNNIKFLYNLDQLKKRTKHINILNFSSSLQYLKDYKTIIKKSLLFKPEIIVIERSPFIKTNQESEIRIQKNIRKIYNVDYPVILFNEKLLINFLNKNNYKLFRQIENADEFFYPATLKSLLFIKK